MTTETKTLKYFEYIFEIFRDFIASYSLESANLMYEKIIDADRKNITILEITKNNLISLLGKNNKKSIDYINEPCVIFSCESTLND